MNKTLAIIFAILFLRDVEAGKNRDQRKAKNAHQQFLHATRYDKPGSFNQCGVFTDIAKKALVEANKVAEFGLSDQEIEALSQEQCKWGLSNYDWYVFEFERGDQVCKHYVVASVTNFLLQKIKNKYYLIKDQTKQANQEDGGCKPKPQTKQEDVTPQHSTSQKIQHDINEEDSQTFTVRPNTYGPAGFKLPMKPQKAAQEARKRNNLKDIVEEDEPVHIEPLFSEFDEEDEPVHIEPLFSEFDEENTYNPAKKAISVQTESQTSEPLVGGWSQCNDEDKHLVPRVFAMLIAQGKIHGVTAYSQNVVECEHQLVNGMNYRAVVAFNHSKCQIAFHKEFSGELSLLSTAPVFQGVQNCVDMLKA